MKLSNRLGAFWVLNLSLIPSVLAAATCDQLSGRIYTGPNSRNFDILCDTSTVIGNIFAYYSEGDEFQDCVDRCDGESNCLVALFLRGSGDCALIDSYQGTSSFNGNDVAIVRPATIPTTTSAESTSAEATTTEATSSEAPTAMSSTAEVSSTEPSTAESSTVVPSSVEVTSAETTTTEAISTKAPSTQSSAAESSTDPSTAESSTVETSSSETSSSDATSTEATWTESSTIEASISQSATNGPSTTEPSSTYATSTEPSSTSAESTLPTTTDSSDTSTATIETSTDDCEDETSTYETSITVIDTTSTETGPGIQSTTLSAHSLTSSTTISHSSEPYTLPSSSDSTSSSPSFLTTTGTQDSVPVSLSSAVRSQEATSLPVSSTSTVTQIHTTHSLVSYLSGFSSSETQEPGSMRLSTSDVTIMTTTTEGRLPTYLPASDCVWTVYLTMVKYVTCSTGLVPETSTTAMYVTVDGNAGTHGPPAVQLPDGCIGGYQVDASGNSYPVVQPTIESQGNPSGEKSHPYVRPTLASPGGSQPSFENGHYHIPAPTAGSHGPPLPKPGSGKPSVQPTQGSQGKSSDSKSQPPVSGQDSLEPNGSQPHRTKGEAAPTAFPAYQSGTPAYPSLSSPIHQGQHNTSMTFTIKTATTGEVQGHSVSSSSSTGAPSTPVIASGSNRYQSAVWVPIAGTLLAFKMLFL